MKPKPKMLLGLFAIIILSLVTTSVILIFKNSKKTPNTFELTQASSRFQINFKLDAKSKNDLSELLKSINVPPAVSNGVSFKLDSTQSARLAFMSPIAADIHTDKSTAEFVGKLNKPPYQDMFEIDQNFLYPKSTVFALFGKNLTSIIKTKYQLGADFTNWLDQNFKSQNPTYFYFFDDSNFVLAAKSDSDLNDLKSVKGQAEDSYKEIEIDGQTLFLTSFGKAEINFSPAFFKIDSWLYITSSESAAREILSLQKENSGMKFLSGKDVSFTAKYLNASQKQLDNLTSLIMVNTQDQIQNKVKSTLLKIDELELTLSNDTFSARVKSK